PTRGAIPTSCVGWSRRSRNEESRSGGYRGIADGAVFPEALRRAIEESDAFLFVITPASVESPYCEQQIEHARMLGKRILPVHRTKVPTTRCTRRCGTATGSRSKPTTGSTAR